MAWCTCKYEGRARSVEWAGCGGWALTGARAHGRSHGARAGCSASRTSGLGQRPRNGLCAARGARRQGGGMSETEASRSDTHRSPVATVRRAVLWVPDWPVVAAMSEAGLGADAPAAVLHGRGLVAVSA